MLSVLLKLSFRRPPPILGGCYFLLPVLVPQLRAMSGCVPLLTQDTKKCLQESQMFNSFVTMAHETAGATMEHFTLLIL